jgi:hypothetical protein
MATVEGGLLELLPTVHALSRADKLRLMQLLIADLAQEEGVPLLEPGASYPIWTPLGTYDAAEVLLQELQKKERGS